VSVPCRSGHTDCTVDCGWCKGTGYMRAEHRPVTPGNARENGEQALRAALALHYYFAEDDCCDPPTYSAECEYQQVCHECGQHWPCDTVRVASGGAPIRPPRRPAGAWSS
jgi:hypothetical protein